MVLVEAVPPPTLVPGASDALLIATGYVSTV